MNRMMELENNRLIAESYRLNQERNTHQAASNRLHERLNELNEQNVVLTKEMRRLNEENTEAACANQAEEMKTNRSARVKPYFDAATPGVDSSDSTCRHFTTVNFLQAHWSEKYISAVE